jgi:hypothetical protein
MSNEELLRDIHTSLTPREPEIVNERTPTWAHVLTVCLYVLAAALVLKAVTA